MSNFSFSHDVFKSCLLLMFQNEYLWSKGLIETMVSDGGNESYRNTVVSPQTDDGGTVHPNKHPSPIKSYCLTPV